LPYNAKIAGNLSGFGVRTHEKFAMASGEMSKEEFTRFLYTAISAAQAHLVDGGLAYLSMDWPHLDELSAAAQAAN
jgi:hypothetical protein